MLTLIGPLRLLFTLGNVWQETAGPYLSRGRSRTTSLAYFFCPILNPAHSAVLESAKKVIAVLHTFTWQWGWGLEQPIIAPLFSKIYWVGGESFIVEKTSSQPFPTP
jgi:hypothetical protein